MAKGLALSTGNLSRGGLSRNSVDRITDRPDMTSAVDRGHKALTQQQEQQQIGFKAHAKTKVEGVSPPSCIAAYCLGTIKSCRHASYPAMKYQFNTNAKNILLIFKG